MSKTKKDNKKAEPVSTPSRRSVIVKLLQECKWTKETLAKKLSEENKAWPEARNKSAISGTVVDLRKRPQRWDIVIDEKGIISVKDKASTKKAG